MIMSVEKYISFEDEDITINKPDEDGVITREILENLYSTRLNLHFSKETIKDDFLYSYLPLRYHFTVPLHIIKDKKIQADKEWLNNVYNSSDERIVFVKGE